MTTHYATIRASDYVFMSRFASTEETRFYLKGVYIDPAGRLVATDGCRMGLLRLSEGRGVVATACPTKPTLILPVQKELLRACKDRGDRNFRRYLVLCADSVRLVEYGAESAEGAEEVTGNMIVATWPAAYIDGTFPEPDRVIPDPLNVEAELARDGTTGRLSINNTAGFNASYIADFGAGDKGDRHRVVRVLPQPNGGPALVLNSDPDFLGVLMPCRGPDHTWADTHRHVMGREEAEALAA